MKKQKGLAPILIILFVALGIGGYLVYQSQTKPVPAPQTQETITPASTFKPASAPQTTPSVSPLSSPYIDQKTSTDSSNWNTYTNQQYNFSLQYPTDWKVLDITEEPVATGITGSGSTYSPLNKVIKQYNEEIKAIFTLLSPNAAKAMSSVVPKIVTEMWISGIRLEIKKVNLADFDNSFDKYIEDFVKGRKAELSNSDKRATVKLTKDEINGNNTYKLDLNHHYYSNDLKSFSEAYFYKNGLVYKLSNDSPGDGHDNEYFNQILSTFKFN